jgi:hypothetical protein
VELHPRLLIRYRTGPVTETATPTPTQTATPTATPTGIENAVVQGRVFEDRDEDGMPDPGEPGVSGASVELRSSGPGVQETRQSAADGSYAFEELAAGTYVVSLLEAPEGYAIFDPVPSFVSVSAGGTTEVDFALLRTETTHYLNLPLIYQRYAPGGAR